MVDDTAAYYAARAAEYDETAGYEDPQAELPRAALKARLTRFFQHHRVLEIACGTGYWTDIIARTADSVVAIDINPEVLAIARQRLSTRGNVRLQVADAYVLAGVPSGFTAACSIWWWSHMPRACWRPFVSRLHSRLAPGACVWMADQLATAYVPQNRAAVGEDYVEDRVLRNGSVFRLIKNHPAEQELCAVLDGLADDVAFVRYPETHTWELTYRVRSVT